MNIDVERRATNEKIFAPGDTLVVLGTSIPKEALIAELSNPNGELVLRTQIDVGANGTFSKVLMQWPVIQTAKFPFGTYSLVVKSSGIQERRATEALKFQASGGIAPSVERELAVHLSAPVVIGKDEVTRIMVQITINGVLVKGDAAETLRDSHIHFPDGSVKPIDRFTVLEDGVYFMNFSSNILGHHTIHIQAFQQGLIANSVSEIFVEEGPVLSQGSQIAKLNTNVESLREETVGKTKEISEAVSNIGSAAGQVTSLLLPIIGMIAIIVALQATMLAKRK